MSDPSSQIAASSPRLHIVSGKGGVGKTTVACALATAYAQAGAQTLLVSFDPAVDGHPCLQVVPGYRAKAVSEGLSLLHIEARAALHEYVRRKMTFSMVYEGLLANPLVSRFLDALPLFDELMCLGKLYDLTTHPDSPYDHVVFDAPASGHCQTLLNVPQVAVNTLVAGPVFHSAQQILGMLRDPARTELVIVTLAEETPVREALELKRYAEQQAQVQAPLMIVNRTISARVTEAELASLAAASASASTAPVLDAARLEHDIAAEQGIQLDRLNANHRWLHLLPELLSTEAYALHERLARQLRSVVQR